MTNIKLYLPGSNEYVAATVQTVSRRGGDYVVEYIDNTGTLSKLNGKKLNDTFKYIDASQKEGYKFLGWETGKNSGNMVSMTYDDQSQKYSHDISEGMTLYPVFKDCDKPKLSVEIKTGWNEKCVVSASATDGGSGVRGYYIGYQNPDEEYVEYSKEASKEITDSGLLYVAAIDNEGNTLSTEIDLRKLTYNVVVSDTKYNKTYTLIANVGETLDFKELAPPNCSLKTLETAMGDTVSDGYVVSDNMRFYAVYEEDKHTFGKWHTAVMPTCVTDGENHRVCEVCGEVDKDVIPAQGHVFGDKWAEVTPMICSEHDGERQRRCEMCEEVEKEIIPMKDNHEMSEWKLSSTAVSKDGLVIEYFTKKCLNCKYTIKTGFTTEYDVESYEALAPELKPVSRP